MSLLTPGYDPNGLAPKILLRNIPTKSATGTVTLDTGASGSVDSITVNSVEIMSGAESYDTSLTVTAANVVININNNKSSPNYTATSSGAVITITGPNIGAQANAYAVVSTCTTITSTDVNLGGGTGGEIQYTFEAKQIAASPTQDFVVSAGAFHLGVNDDFGHFAFVIEDYNNLLTDGSADAKPLIKQQWGVELWLGKNSGNLSRWFYGTVLDVKVARPITGIQQIQVLAGGWGVKTKHRYTKIKRFQGKDADGLTLDSTDANSKVSEYFKDVLQDGDHYITDGLAGQSEITVNNVQDIDIKLADFQQTAQTWAGALSTLAAWANCYWGIDADRDAYLHQVGSQDSGFLFTNDLSGLDAQGWSATKIGYLSNTIFDYTNSSGAGAYSILHGLGGNEVKLDINTKPNTVNGTSDLNANWHAIKFTPNFDNLAKISLILTRVGTPASGSAHFLICGDDGASKPNTQDLRGVATIGQSKLQELPTSGSAWVEISFEQKEGIPVEPLTALYIVCKKYGNASNTISIGHDTTTNTTYWTSSDGVTWTTVSGAPGVEYWHRVYVNRPVTVTLEDVLAKNKYGTRELAFALRQDIQVETIQEALLQASETLCREQRVYNNITVTPVTDRIPLGKYCRVQDTKSGLDIHADVIGVDGEFSTDGASNIGVQSLTLTLQEITTS